MSRCAHLYTGGYLGPANDGRCGRAPTRGGTLCATHDPALKAATRARHLRRQAGDPAFKKARERAAWERSRLIAEIQELALLWDGPGSEGRCV